MSKFDLRDISERLSNSTDTEAVVFEFIGYLQAVRSDWRVSLAFYEVSRDAFVSVYERQGSKLLRREVSIAVDQLPARLVRKFFHPNAIFKAAGRSGLLSQLLHTSPIYEPDPAEAPALQSLVAVPVWQSCACLPLTDHEDILALLLITSDKKNAFVKNAIDAVMPIRSMASMALAQHLHRAGRDFKGPHGSNGSAGPETSGIQDRIRKLTAETHSLEEDNREKSERLAALSKELAQLDQSSSNYRKELERVKGTITMLEEQTMLATEHLNHAYTELDAAQNRLNDFERTVDFMKHVLDAIANSQPGDDLGSAMMDWICEKFAIERCSLMMFDAEGATLRIVAARGIDADMAAKVRVRVGQGIAGWVAHHKKPLLVRVRDEAPSVGPRHADTYNSDSFVCVPLIHRSLVLGVLNLSNREDGEPFETPDMDRAMMAASILAMNVPSQDPLARVLAA